MMERMVEKKVGGQDLTTPSVSYGNTNLYMRGPLEEDTRPNLTKVRRSYSSVTLYRMGTPIALPITFVISVILTHCLVQ